MGNDKDRNTQEEKNIKKLEIPSYIQKQMLEFFMQTSIPRKKINNNKTPLSEETKER